MLIFGLSARQLLMATLFYVCETCGQHAGHRLVRRTNWFTLFFIPLFPVGSRYIDTCAYCGRSIQVPRDRAEMAAAQGSPELR
jgi:hypothetical protein